MKYHDTLYDDGLMLKWPGDEQRVSQEIFGERDESSKSEPLVCVRAWCRWVIRPFRSQTGTRSSQGSIRLCVLVFRFQISD